MAIIYKKTWKEYFDKIISGEKKFDLRVADFEIKTGDILVLEEWDEDKRKYTGRKIEVIANYVLKTKDLPFFSKEDIDKHGLQIIQFDKKMT